LVKIPAQFHIFESVKYPIGIQDFRKLREGDYVYVDKTACIYDVITQGVYNLFYRPFGFGKSLLLSTIKELYSGNRELFKGLWVEDQWDWEQMQRPVILLRFADFNYKDRDTRSAIREGIETISQDLGVEISQSSFFYLLHDLVRATYDKYSKKVVLLVDDYDKPIIDHLDRPAIAEENQAAIMELFSFVKDSGPYLEMVFFTGVTFLNRNNAFSSSLNNLLDLSLYGNTQKLVGFTQSELEHYFAEPLAGADKEKVRRWYNGYSWGRTEKLYNPRSILRFFASGGAYQSFWSETRLPTPLLKKMKKEAFQESMPVETSQMMLSMFDIHRVDLVPLLFQTGCLTIAKYEPESFLYTLDYPNEDVRQALEL
jgi:predicted small secreted protein